MKRTAAVWLIGFALLSPAPAASQTAAPELPATEALIARAKKLELNTPYVPPPGDPLEHDTAGFAKVMCSAVFITGLDPEFAAENVGYFTGPYASHDLVVVRLGHYKGGTPGNAAPATAALKKALSILMEAVPPKQAS